MPIGKPLAGEGRSLPKPLLTRTLTHKRKEPETIRNPW